MRSSNWLWLATLLLAAPACKQQGNGSLTAGRQENDQVKQEQKQAQDSLKQAEDAQKKATREQDQARSAQADVDKARQDLNDKQQKAQQQQSEAQQSQAQAQQQGQSAQQNASEAQQRASEAQNAQQSASASQQPGSTAGGEEQITGKLAKVSDTELQLDSVPQPLKIDSSTQVTLDGQPASAAQLQPGTDVRASFRRQGSEATAIKIDAKSANK